LRSALAAGGELPDGVVLDDGSGLSRANRLTPALLARVLEGALRGPHRELFTASLAQAGVDGTLADRLEGLGGRVRAKSGTLAGVSALSGLVKDEGERLVMFVILMNAEGRRPASGTRMRALQDRIVLALAARGRGDG
jgi:D-alanyl-D-alanine carboxypeptidase/D-alanyl-D-alanine-endopeptidase (penicillin-binding protein 4)